MSRARFHWWSWLVVTASWVAAASAAAQVPGSAPPETERAASAAAAAPANARASEQKAAPANARASEQKVVPANARASKQKAAPADARASEQKVVPNATVVQPRAFGHTVGDVLTQRVLLGLKGREFVPAELPPTGRVGVWFERRAVRLEDDEAGRRWLRVDYQLMNSPQSLRVVTLPAWKIKPAEGTGGELRVAEWPISVAPLTPERADARAGLGALRPDRIAPPISIEPIERGLRIGVTGLVLTALAWVAWLFWRNWRASANQPFARAMSEMRGFDGTAPESWFALHRAFDATAGSAVRSETLPELFRRAPHLAPLKAQIEEFFRQSAARFFAESPPRTELSAHVLCRQLRRIEKRHER